jgi:CO dehydrogenase maturation factor
MKIAISGKGGVGKTTILAMLAHHLKESGQEVLIIDADPSPHMAQTIGVRDVEKIVPIADMKNMLVERSGKSEGSPFYNLNPKVDDLLERYMVEEDSLRLMVLGAVQTAKGGCACPENTVLKRLLTTLLLSSSRTILLDMEAGVEHLGRGTIASVDLLLIVVIPSRSSIRTALKIKKLAEDSGIPQVAFVANLVQENEDEQFLKQFLNPWPVAFFPEVKSIKKSERLGEPITKSGEEMTGAVNELAKFIRDHKTKK